MTINYRKKEEKKKQQQKLENYFREVCPNINVKFRLKHEYEMLTPLQLSLGQDRRTDGWMDEHTARYTDWRIDRQPAIRVVVGWAQEIRYAH